MAGRGSFIESFPLFGYDLDDYDELFTEKLELLLAIRAKSAPTWEGRLRAAAEGPRRLSARAAEPPARLDRGRRHAAIGRARRSLGLPLAMAIIGGEPARFAPMAASLSRGRQARRPGSRPLALGINGHGFLADTAEAAAAAFYGPTPRRCAGSAASAAGRG